MEPIIYGLEWTWFSYIKIESNNGILGQEPLFLLDDYLFRFHTNSIPMTLNRDLNVIQLFVDDNDLYHYQKQYRSEINSIIPLSYYIKDMFPTISYYANIFPRHLSREIRVNLKETYWHQMTSHSHLVFRWDEYLYDQLPEYIQQMSHQLLLTCMSFNKVKIIKIQSDQGYCINMDKDIYVNSTVALVMIGSNVHIEHNNHLLENCYIDRYKAKCRGKKRKKSFSTKKKKIVKKNSRKNILFQRHNNEKTVLFDNSVMLIDYDKWIYNECRVINKLGNSPGYLFIFTCHG